MLDFASSPPDRQGRRNGIERFTAQLLRDNTAALRMIESVVGPCDVEIEGAYRVVSFDP